MTSPHILVMSDNPAHARALCALLTQRLCYPEIASGEADALLRVRRPPRPDLVLLELNGGPYDLDTLKSLRSLCPEIKVVVVSAANDTRRIVEAIRLGARDYLTMPVNGEDMDQVLRRHAPEQSASMLSLVTERVEDLGEGKFFVAASAAMRKVRDQAERLANIDAPVLILGENGSGKEVVARLIHKFSSRSRERFVKVNCAALPGDLLESELFGYESGAFGATHTKTGKFELCHRGTILLDEVAVVPASLQAELLQVLQERQFFRPNEEQAIDVDVRILAAMSLNLDAVLADSRLREDLYYQLSAFTISIPPLRERRDEIPVLLRHFMARMAAQYSRPPIAFSRSVMDACLHYSWPGNLRELKNFVKRYLVMGEEAIANGELRSEPSRRQISGSGPILTEQSRTPRKDKEPTSDELPTYHLKSMVRDLKDEAEIRAIMQALHETHWNRKRAARLLDISYRGLLYKIRQHSLTQTSEESSPGSARDGRFGKRDDFEIPAMLRRNNEKF
jgi:DNA-binding NtrC family response regulator